MEELVIMKNQQAVTTSLQVAEVFGKKHQHVMEAIRKLTVENSTVKKMFVESTYANSRGQEWPLFYMNTKNGRKFIYDLLKEDDIHPTIVSIEG